MEDWEEEAGYELALIKMDLDTQEDLIQEMLEKFRTFGIKRQDISIRRKE